MRKEYDVAIIGGGVIGVCSAYYLACEGLDVILIEKGEVASGCSYGNGGLIVPSHSVPMASPGALGDGLRWLFDPESPFYIRPRLSMDLFGWLLRFLVASRQPAMLHSMPVLRDLLTSSAVLYAELAQIAGFEFGYESKGNLWVCLSPQVLEQEKREIRLLERFHIPVQLMDREQIHELEPALLPTVVGGVFYPRDGHIDPLRFVVGLADKARELGAEICTNTEVLGFDAAAGKITRIHTTRGDVPAKEVILAAGSWTPAVVRALRLKIPIQAAKGYSITLENPDPCPKLPLLLGETLVVVNPLGNALRLAGTLEMAGMDLSFNTGRLAAIHDSSAAYLPGLAEAKVIEIWRGLRPCTPDGLPVIGRSKEFNNLIVAAGHAMLGMSLGPVTGRLVTQLVCQAKPEMDLFPLRMERF